MLFLSISTMDILSVKVYISGLFLLTLLLRIPIYKKETWKPPVVSQLPLLLVVSLATKS